MLLEELVKQDTLENETMECKARLNREDVLGWLKTVAGFANAGGGDLYLGVEDKTNLLIGFDRKEADNERNYFNNQVNEHLVPRPAMKISFLRYENRGEEKYILHISVPESDVKPVILKYKGVPAIFMRREGFTNGATYEEIIEMSIRSQNTQYDSLLSDRKYDANEYTTLREYYAMHNDGKALTEKALQSMGFYNAEGLLANGAILFADHYDGAKTKLQCSVFGGYTKGSERIITINRFQGNLIASIEYMMAFVEQRMNHSMLKLADGRENLDAYPQRALFEGIVNAVAHRDYFLDGTQIQVDMFRDRLEIKSPGSFYRGEKPEKTYDLSNIISKRRNELITAVLVSCNVMEAAGTGFDKVAEAYAGADDAHKPYIYSSSDHFTLVLPDLTYTEGVTDSAIPRLSFVPPENATKYDEEVLAFCYYQAHKASEIAARLKISDSSHLRRQVLGNLVTQGYLHMSTSGRTTYYRTNADMVTLL